MDFPVTAIIPCHNAEKWLDYTLDSVAAQVRKPDHVIVIADNCSDRSADVARAHPLNVQVLESTFGNAASARNLGIEHVTTPWIALLDADDYWYPTHIENAAQILAGSEHVAYCAGDTFMDNDANELPLPSCFWQGWPKAHTHLTHDDYVDLMLKDMHFNQCTVIYRVDRFREVGGYNPQQLRRHDLDLWLRMIHEQKWAWHPGPAARYRYQTPGSISRNTVQVTYYQLTALLRNQTRYNNPRFDSRVDAYARRAMSVALHDADATWSRKLRDAARDHLPAHYRLGYDVINCCPWLFKGLIKLKRQTLGKVQRSIKRHRDDSAAAQVRKQETP